MDGSFNGDTTVLVVAAVDQRPHIDLVELWQPDGRQVHVVDGKPPSGPRAGADGSWRSPPTRSAGPAASSSSTKRAYPSWRTRRVLGG